MRVPSRIEGMIQARAAHFRMRQFSIARTANQFLAIILAFGLLFATWPQTASAQDNSVQDQTAQDQVAQQDNSQPATQQATQQSTQGQQPYNPQTAAQLDQLVAPIALYPDSLVAQVLAAATFPDQVVEADRWVQANSNLTGTALAQAADQQPWDPSVKALVAFPTVLANMDKNLSWTSSLGDAYYNQQQDVMDAVQYMRQKAQASGNLKTTQQQVVNTQGSTIVIQPANPQVVYVPAYNPWAIYGYPVAPWPGWYPYPGIWYGGPYLSFGLGFGIGFFAGFGWGWGHWGFDWHNHYVVYNHNRYYSGSRTFYNRNAYYHNGGAYGHGNAYAHGATNVHAGNSYAHGYNGAANHPFNGNTQAARGYGQPHGATGTHSNAFSGYNHGGQTRSYSARGQSSVGHSSGGGGGHSGGGGGGHHH